jgi:hypothetical protein
MHLMIRTFVPIVVSAGLWGSASAGAAEPQHRFDAFSAERQKEIKEVLDLLAKFRPTTIAVEVKTGRQGELDESYASYLAGEKELSANEMHQFGFRLGKMLKLERLHAVDIGGRSYFPDMTEEEYGTKIGALLEGVDPARIAAEEAWSTRYEQMYDWEDASLDRQSLKEHLLFLNDEQTLLRHHGHYLIGSFKLGREDDYFGPDMKTAWYNRNLRIFNNVQRITQGPKDRILILIGAGHVPILRQAVLSSPQYDLIEVSDVLTGKGPPINSAAPTETAQYAFIIGVWNCKTRFMNQKGEYGEGRATWTGRLILDGWAIQDDWVSQAPGGGQLHGTNIRSFNSQAGKWDNRWLAAGSLQWKYFESEQVGETMVMIGGEGKDPRGAFIDRNTFYDISDDSWSWRKDRSYDGGKTWIEGIGFIEATRAE